MTGRFRALGRSAGIAAVAASALLLAACNAIPGTGPVNVGLSDLTKGDQLVSFSPSGPAKGASQKDIVTGFVLAASSSRDDYEVAREFLTPEYSGQWDPSNSAFIDEGARPFRSAEDGVGVLALSGSATVDEHGVLTPAKPGPTSEVRFELTKVDGQWRIASAPAGVILDRATFKNVWAPRDVAFLSPDNRLVTETRWFLNNSSTMATQVVDALISGPAEEMRGATRTAFPEGTALATNSVPVIDGTAKVNLIGQAESADPETRQLIFRQLAASLQSVTGVNRFEFSINGALIESSAVGWADGGTPSADPRNTLVLSHGTFGSLLAGKVEALPKLGRRIVELRPDAVTVSPDRSSAVVRARDSLTWTDGAEEVPIPTAGSQPLEPSIDRFGYVWSSAASTGGSIIVVKPGEDPVTLSIPWGSGLHPAAVRISPDGVRIAMLSAEGDGSVVRVGGIVRDAHGRPTGITGQGPTQLWATGSPLDLDWSDAQHFAALTRVGEAGKVTIGAPGQFAVESGSVPGANRLSGGGSKAFLRVLGSDGKLFAGQGIGWQQQFDDVQVLAKVG